MPSLRQLEYLVALSETRHFRKAAERVGVSQPTLSAQLSALEDRLQSHLVERSRSMVLLTPIGERIVEIARRVLRDVQEIEDLAAGERGDFGAAIRLGLPPTIGPYLLPLVVPQLHRAHPNFKIYVREQVPRDLPSGLADGVHDIVLAPLPIPGADIVSAPIFREPLSIVVADDHPLAEKGEVERKDLSGQPVLALERGHQLHEQVEAICDEFGAKLVFDYEGTSLDTLRQMVGLGMGVSFLPRLYVEMAVTPGSGVTPLEVKGRALSRTIGLAWRKTSSREREFRVILEHVRSTVAREFPSFPLI